MVESGYDPRAVANLILDLADEKKIAITNLALQKLLYFAHATYLIGNGAPLVSGYFEAWQYGPVHPTVYQAFSTAGAQPIRTRACSEDIMTGTRSIVPVQPVAIIHRHISQIVESYGRMTPGRLVEISHAKGAPWHFIVDKARTSVAFGLRIPDNVIVERFKHHKVPVGGAPLLGEPSEESPFA